MLTVLHTYWRQMAALSRAQHGWLGFMLLLTGGIFGLSFSYLTLFSGASLIFILCILGWTAWRWPAMQLSTVLLGVVYVLISLTGTGRQMIGWALLLLALLPGCALLVAVAVEFGKTSLTYRHVVLVCWLALISGVLAILLAWFGSPGTESRYAGLPMTHVYVVLVWAVVAMLWLYLWFVRAQTRLRGAFIALLPAAMLGLYLGRHYLAHGLDQPGVPEPILEHGLLLVHVPLMILAFGLLMNCAGLGLLRLVSDSVWLKQRQNMDILETVQISLEDYLYRQLVLAVMLLGAGLLSGMWWADLAWGHYWQWEAKQVMAMACWLYYLAGLHLRLQKGMQTRPFAWWCVAGLPLLVLTIIGTNLWPQGLHNFGTL